MSTCSRKYSLTNNSKKLINTQSKVETNYNNDNYNTLTTYKFSTFEFVWLNLDIFDSIWTAISVPNIINSITVQCSHAIRKLTIFYTCMLAKNVIVANNHLVIKTNYVRLFWRQDLFYLFIYNYYHIYYYYLHTCDLCF